MATSPLSRRIVIKFVFLIVLCSSSLAQFTASRPPAYLGKPGKDHAPNNRGITLVPSIVVAKNGRLWATWYAGVTSAEDSNNYVVLATSMDQGKTWKEVLVADPDGEGPLRAFDPELWTAPDGNLYWLWTQGKIVREAPLFPMKWDTYLWALKITNPSEESPQYESPTLWTEGVMMHKPITLSTGEWVLPVSLWKEERNSARMVISTDQGKSWSVRGAADVPKEMRTFDEHSILERKDGSLWMLIRSKNGIAESISTNRGKDWSPVKPSSIPHTSSRFFLTRLQSENILLVKHAPDPETKKIKRTHLTAFLSKDEGKTWSDGLLIDAREIVSYPDGQQAPDGTIFLVYDRNRTTDREIFLASFTEENLLGNTSPSLRLRQLVSKGFGGVSKEK